MPTIPRIGVGVIVYNSKGEVLLGYRTAGHGALAWQFPGGHLEFQESVADCAVREVQEECGIRIKNLRTGPYTEDFFTGENRHYLTVYVIADLAEGVPRVMEPDKCRQWEWFPETSLPTPRFLPLANLLTRFGSLSRVPATPLPMKGDLS